MWHDNETTTDYLNFGVVADACAKLLQQANGQPISIGVSGGWGVGKSSLVRMVASRLNVDADPDKNTYVVVTFNPWLYQDFEGARSALLQMVGDEVLRRAAADEGLVRKAKRLLQRINLLRVVQLGGEAAATIATGIPIGLIGRALAKFGLSDEQGEAGDDRAEKDEDWGLLKPAEPVSLPGEIQAFRDALEELLEELKDTHGLSFIFICHNLALVQSFCDKVLVLYDGKVVESGKPDDIINEPKEAYTKKLVDAVFE